MRISSLTLWEPALQTNPLETVWTGALAPHWLISAGWPSPVGQNSHKIHNKWILFHNSAGNLRKALFSPDPHWWWRMCLQWRPDEWCSHHHCSESKERGRTTQNKKKFEGHMDQFGIDFRINTQCSNIWPLPEHLLLYSAHLQWESWRKAHWQTQFRLYY